MDKVNLTKDNYHEIREKAIKRETFAVFEVNLIHFIIGIVLALTTSKIRFMFITCAIIGETFMFTFMNSDIIRLMHEQYRLRYDRKSEFEKDIRRKTGILKIEECLILAISYWYMSTHLLGFGAAYRWTVILVLVITWLLSDIHRAVIKSAYKIEG